MKPTNPWYEPVIKRPAEPKKADPKDIERHKKLAELEEKRFIAKQTEEVWE